MAQCPTHLPPAEQAGQPHFPVHKHDRYLFAVLGGKTHLIDIHDLETPTEPVSPPNHQWERFVAQVAAGPGEEANDRHYESGIVARPMRPATVFAIMLLLLVLTVAGIVFIIQLLSVT